MVEFENEGYQHEEDNLPRQTSKKEEINNSIPNDHHIR